MKIFELEENIPLFCITASSFPQGIPEAFQQLIQKLPTQTDKTFFGIAYPGDSGVMIYKAAVRESFSGEADQYGCESLILQKGSYLTETVRDWKNNTVSIHEVFSQLGAAGKNVEPPIVEWYQGADVLCMLRLASSEG